MAGRKRRGGRAAQYTDAGIRKLQLDELQLRRERVKPRSIKPHGRATMKPHGRKSPRNR